MAADGIATVAATAARVRARARAMEHPHRLRQIARARQLRESAGRAGRIAGRIAEKTVAPSVVLAMIAIAVMAAAGPRATAGATIAARNAMTGSTPRPAPPRRRSGPLPTPDSPFAALSALKLQLEKRGNETGSS